MSVSIFADKEKQPTMDEVLAVIGGKRPHWESLVEFMQANYGAEPFLNFYGKSYGWMFAFKQAARTLLALYPQKGGFTAQVVLGLPAVEKTADIPLGDTTRQAITKANRFREGAWVYLTVNTAADVDDIKKLVVLKQAPPDSKWQF